MTRMLNGRELADFIKSRQLRQVRNLRQEHRIIPKLCIIESEHASPVIETYVRMKQRYADDVLIEVEIVKCPARVMPEKIKAANADESVHGIIVQLPIDDEAVTDEVVNGIAATKDVDGLSREAKFTSATAEAIDWLLVGYNIELVGKQIALLGRGRLVGAPLEKMWRERGLNVRSFSKSDIDHGYISTSDVVVTATGAPGALKTAMLKPRAIVVDAGTASEEGVIIGDIDNDVRDRDDLTITPEKGGVGPLTVAVMFDHVIQAALARVHQG